ncbi:MAG: hypothetical protein D6754_09350 [Alphaproteobacteria bacterium]|nr:MAG: hypothetical protein D6754_09350 [Alphaproteobacteria bacterium]
MLTEHTGTNGNVTLTDTPGNDTLDGGKGDDVLIFTTTGAAGSTDAYDGSKGYDTIRIVMTAAQHQNALFQQELAAYQTFLAQHAHGGSDDGPSFTFTSLGLTLSNFETVEVAIDDAVNTGPVAADDAGAIRRSGAMTAAASPGPSPTATRRRTTLPSGPWGMRCSRTSAAMARSTC